MFLGRADVWAEVEQECQGLNEDIKDPPPQVSDNLCFPISPFLCPRVENFSITWGTLKTEPPDLRQWGL